MEKSSYIDTINNGYLSDYKHLNSKIRTSIAIWGNLATPEKAKKVEVLQNIFLNWYERWKEFIFIQNVEYLEGYSHLDLICTKMARAMLPRGLIHETIEWSYSTHEKYEDTESPEDAHFLYREDVSDAVYILEGYPSKKDRNLSEKSFSNRAFLKKPWNPDISNLKNPINVSIGMYDGNDDLNLYLLNVFYEWGENWNEEIIVHYEPMCNYISLDMTCSDSAYYAIPNYIICGAA